MTKVIREMLNSNAMEKRELLTNVPKAANNKNNPAIILILKLR